MRPTGGSRWDMAGKIISFDHVWVTQSTSHLAWKPGMVSSTHITGSTQLTVRVSSESRAHTVRHNMGLKGGKTSVALHRVFNLQCASVQDMSYSYL